jgi:hypothetical protein
VLLDLNAPFVFHGNANRGITWDANFPRRDRSDWWDVKKGLKELSEILD